MVECLHRTSRISFIGPIYMEKKKTNNFLAWIAGIAILFISGGVFLFFSIGGILSPQDKLGKADVIVAISGGETYSRTLEAINLYKDGWAPNLLFSGAARSGEVSNAESMKKYALDKNISASNIYLDEESTSTYENALNSKDIIEKNNWDKIILVTSPYHQRRAYMNFRYVLGDEIKIINHSSGDLSWETSRWYSPRKNLSTTLDEISRILYLVFTKDYSKEVN